MRAALFGLSLATALAGACHHDAATPPPAPPPPRIFSADFRFGVAIAGFQVDMGCPTIPSARCNDPDSDWYVWVTDPRIKATGTAYLSGDPVESGPGFYELYGQDLDRVHDELHGNALRLSIEWSRLFPTSTVGVSGYDALKQIASADALAYYHAIFDAMKARGIRPFVTLNHYTLPSWIHDAYGCFVDISTCTQRGWVDHDPIVGEIAKYAGFVAQEFGGDVDDWATLNEPMAMLISAYVLQSPTRTNPPGVFLDAADFKRAMLNMVDAHARMYDAVKAADQVDADGDGSAAAVGIVYNLTATGPKDASNALDVAGAKNFDYLMNRAFLGAVIKGDLDAALDGTTVHHDELAGRCDFLGVNYYDKVLLTGRTASQLPDLSPLLTIDFTAIDTSEEYPQGIYEMLTEANQWGVPLVVSETGHVDPKDDGSSARWLAQTVSFVERALADGVDVRGYYYWTLMDLYEWNHGMTVAGGLYAVDSHDPMKARHARSGVAAFRQISDAGRVPADLAAMYPVPN